MEGVVPKQEVVANILTPPMPGLFHNVTIRAYTHPEHYLFVSNDTNRQYNSDYDVRTHPYQEERNKFELDHDGYGNCKVMQQLSGFYVFAADDGSRSYNGDYDVRAHLNIEDRNVLFFEKTQYAGIFRIKLTNTEDD